MGLASFAGAAGIAGAPSIRAGKNSRRAEVRVIVLSLLRRVASDPRPLLKCGTSVAGLSHCTIAEAMLDCAPFRIAERHGRTPARAPRNRCETRYSR